MLGHSDEMRLLLNQTNPAEAGRTLTYYGYFAKERAARIDKIDAEEARLQDLVAEIERQTEELKSLRDDASREVSDLERARQERGTALAALAGQVQSGHEELARLHRQEQAVEGLVTELDASASGFSGRLAPAFRSAARQAPLAGRRQDDRALSRNPHQRCAERGATRTVS